MGGDRRKAGRYTAAPSVGVAGDNVSGSFSEWMDAHLVPEVDAYVRLGDVLEAYNDAMGGEGLPMENLRVGSRAVRAWFRLRESPPYVSWRRRTIYPGWRIDLESKAVPDRWLFEAEAAGDAPPPRAWR